MAELNENFDKKELAKKYILEIRNIMDEWQKNKNSRINQGDYIAENEILNQKRKNKFRTNYFQSLIGRISFLMEFLPDNEEYLQELEGIKKEVKRQNDEFRKISEDLVDKIDFFTIHFLNKVEKYV